MSHSKTSLHLWYKHIFPHYILPSLLIPKLRPALPMPPHRRLSFKIPSTPLTPLLPRCLLHLFRIRRRTRIVMHVLPSWLNIPVTPDTFYSFCSEFYSVFPSFRHLLVYINHASKRRRIIGIPFLVNSNTPNVEMATIEWMTAMRTEVMVVCFGIKSTGPALVVEAQVADPGGIWGLQSGVTVCPRPERRADGEERRGAV